MPVYQRFFSVFLVYTGVIPEWSNIVVEMVCIPRIYEGGDSKLSKLMNQHRGKCRKEV